MIVASTPAGTARVQLRPLRPEDMPFLLELYASTRAAELDQTSWDAPTRSAFFQMQFAAQHSHYSTHYRDANLDVIVVDGVDVGRLYVHRTIADIALMDIALMPSYRERGFGSQILRCLLDEASVSHRPVTLHVEANNPRAHAWYRRFGFIDVSSTGMHTFMRRDPQPSRADGDQPNTAS